jgi:hypothetical protein
MTPARWVHVLVDVPASQAERAGTFWSDALGWPLGAPWPGLPAFRSFEPPGADAYVHLQVGDHGPRVHVDLEVDDLAAETVRLVELGARMGARREHWQVMTSPGGLPFCLLNARPRSPVAPVRWPDGHRSRLVQVCIDSPPALQQAEVAFWRAATGWRWVPADEPPFAGKLYGPAGGAAQFLLQQLDPDDGATATRAHIDLGTDDRQAEAERLVSIGAERRWSGGGWITLADPTGMLFCATGNPPD